MVNRDTELSKYLEIEDGVEGATTAKHKVEFAFYNLDENGNPTKGSEDLFGIIECKKVGYKIRYLFKREGQPAAFKYWVNGQHAFKSSFQKLPAQTNSDELFEAISKILESPTPIVVRNNVEGILTQIEFDIVIEEETPFLKNLFDEIVHGLNDGEVMSNIQHLPYRERYSLEKNEGICIVDFIYDKDGFFGNVQPLEAKCNSPELIAKIKAIVNNLKEADYVI